MGEPGTGDNELHGPPLSSAEGNQAASQEVALDSGKLSLSFDKQRLQHLREKAPGQAKDVIETVLRLPEKLEFNKGITLIVGENGSGKSALAKAIFFARRIDEMRRNGEERGLNGLRKGSEDQLLLQSGGPLVAELAECIILDPHK